MAPDIATKHNYCHHKQGKISRQRFQNANEKVAEPLLINNKLNKTRTPTKLQSYLKLYTT